MWGICTLCSCVGEYQGSGLCGSRAVGTCVEGRADGNAVREHPGSGCGHETPALHEVVDGSLGWGGGTGHEAPALHEVVDGSLGWGGGTGHETPALHAVVDGWLTWFRTVCMGGGRRGA